MIAEGKDFMHDAPWIALFPGFAILVTAMAANFIGDGLRDALDPRTPIDSARG
jgi:ABC-type dipeptide/oligopeptide/nickel transport system permease subunit